MAPDRRYNRRHFDPGTIAVFLNTTLKLGNICCLIAESQEVPFFRPCANVFNAPAHKPRLDSPSCVLSADHCPRLQQELGAVQLPRPNGPPERGISPSCRRVSLFQRHPELQEQRQGFRLTRGRGFVQRRKSSDGGAIPPPASSAPVRRSLVERGRQRSPVPCGTASNFARRVSHGNHRLGGSSFSITIKQR